MRGRKRSYLFSFILLLFFLFTSVHMLSAQESRGKVALVIGNSAYKGGNRLENPVNDAGAVGKTLADFAKRGTAGDGSGHSGV